MIDHDGLVISLMINNANDPNSLFYGLVTLNNDNLIKAGISFYYVTTVISMANLTNNNSKSLLLPRVNNLASTSLINQEINESFIYNLPNIKNTELRKNIKKLNDDTFSKNTLEQIGMEFNIPSIIGLGSPYKSLTYQESWESITDSHCLIVILIDKYLGTSIKTDSTYLTSKKNSGQLIISDYIKDYFEKNSKFTKLKKLPKGENGLYSKSTSNGLFIKIQDFIAKNESLINGEKSVKLDFSSSALQLPPEIYISFLQIFNTTNCQTNEYFKIKISPRKKLMIPLRNLMYHENDKCYLNVKENDKFVLGTDVFAYMKLAIFDDDLFISQNPHLDYREFVFNNSNKSVV